MKGTTKELLKLNNDYSIVELKTESSTQYVVCFKFNPEREVGNQWSQGHYFQTLEDAVKYSALHCYEPIERYRLLKVEHSCAEYNTSIKMFTTWYDVYKYITTLYKDWKENEEENDSEYSCKTEIDINEEKGAIYMKVIEEYDEPCNRDYTEYYVEKVYLS